MQRMIVVAILGLTSYISVADLYATAPRPPARFSIVLRIGNASPMNGSDSVLTIRIGIDEIPEFSPEQRGTHKLAQYFESWCETARYALFKQLRMA